MMQVHTTVNRLMAEHEAAIKHAYPLRDVLGAGRNVSHRKPWYAKVDADGVLTGLGLLLLAVLLVGCKATTPPPAPPVVLHPAGATAAKEQADCHPTEQAATMESDEERAEIKPWWETHNPRCPKTMRMVFPSDREVDKAASYGMDNWMNWRYQHVVCIPDGQP